MKITDNSYQFNLSKVLRGVKNHWNPGASQKEYDFVSSYCSHLAGIGCTSTKNIIAISEPFTVEDIVFVLAKEENGDIHVAICPGNYFPSHSAWKESEYNNRVKDIQQRLKELQEELDLLKASKP